MKKIVSIVALLCLAVLTLTACNSTVASVADAQNKAFQTATLVKSTASVYDGEIEVYRYSKEIVVMSDSMSVTTGTAELNSSFQLTETTNSETLPLDRNAFKGLNLSKKNASEQEKNTDEEGKEIITLSVAKSNIQSVLGVTIEATTDAVVTAELVEGKLISLSMSFATATKTIVLQYSYNY